MFNIKWLNLQLFAGEGAGDGGGEGAATGENAADPGRQRLLELGVPESKLRKNRAYSPKAAAQPPAASKADPQQQDKEQAAAADNPTEEKNNVPARMSWDEIMRDPEYNKQMQAVVQSRLRSAKAAEEALSKLTPALELQAKKYGQDPAKIDYDALAKSISEDDSYYEDKALELGVSVETAKQIDQQERENARQEREEATRQREEQRTFEAQMFQNHIRGLEEQGKALKKLFPNFDLRTELENPAFARMTAPGKGIMSVEDAYRAVHRKEIEAAAGQVIAQQTANNLSRSIQAGTRRPAENGTSGQAPSVTTFDYSKASREEREAFKKHIQSERAAGRKVYPGTYRR